MTAFGVASIAPTADATGVLPTTTTVSASPSTALFGTSVTLTASVSLSALVTPLGTVTFKTNNGEGTLTLGSSQLGNCNLLNACTASLTTTQIPVGTNTVTATYGGDSLSAPSSGTTTVVITNPPPASSNTTTCPSGPCSTAIVYAADGSSAAQAISDPSSGSNTMTISMGGTSEPCSTPNGGQPTNFDSTAPDASKRIDYWVFDQYAATLQSALTANLATAHVCFASNTTFHGTYPDPKKGKWVNGYIQGTSKFGFVPLNANGEYVGLLPACNNTNNSSNDGSIADQGNNAPCYVVEEYVPSTFAGHTMMMHIAIIAAPGDPRTTG
jgi:hypothetical protein